MPGPTILLVEDNATTRKMVKYALENGGYQVFDAPDGRTALRMMEEHQPALVLQDLILPDIDGFDLVAKLRRLATDSGVPILAFSGLLSGDEEARMSAVGFDDVISKPIEPSRLIPIINAHLPASAAVEARFGDGRLLLVADDDPQQLKLTRFRLARLGFELETACDGEEALAVARRTMPDAIVADVMMPKLDGFGLSMAVRQDAALSRTPLVLVTSKYIETADRELGFRAGADEFVVRTPDLQDLIHALRNALDRKKPARPAPLIESQPDIEQQRAQTVLRQLERQVLLNTGLAKRCSALASELTVIAGISEAVLKHRDLDVALDEALAACFDAGGISVGALYLLNEDGSLRVRPLGNESRWAKDDLDSFFGQPELLRTAMASGETLMIPSGAVPPVVATELLARAAGCAALVVPLVHLSRPLGALLMVARGREIEIEHWTGFAYGVGNQIAQVLALANAYGEKEAAEKQSREQAALLRLILDSVAEGVIMSDTAGDFLLWNSAARHILPPGPAAVPPEQWSEYYGLHRGETGPFPAGELPLVRAMGGEHVDDVEMLVCPTGQEKQRWISVTARPLIADGGEIRGAVAVFRDVTAQKWAERELLRSRAEWQALVQQSPDLVMRLDLKGRITYLNRVEEGYDIQQVTGTDWLDYVTPDQRPRLQRVLETAIATGEPVTYEAAVPSTHGLLWYSSNLGPIRHNDETVGAIIISRDITNRKQTEEQLIVSDRMASIGTLAAGVAHEINNPLSSVLANLDLALKGLSDLGGATSLPADLVEELRDARDGAERVREIVRDLRIFSRSNEEARGPVDVRRVLESTLRMAWNEIRHRARLVKDFGNVPPVDANESRLGQVFLNMIINAAQAIPDGNADLNEIRIRTYLRDGSVVVSFADTGSGIPEEVRGRIFTPFFTTKPVGVGTGLGLSICHRLITSFGGEIQFDTETNRGTEFRIILPAAELKDQTRVTDSSVPVAAVRRGRVLVVDDEVIITHAIRRALSPDHDVVPVTSAREALQAIESSQPFDVILCDLMMPQMTGMELHEELKQRSPETLQRMIFLTGGAFTPRAREFLDTVDNQRVEKPFNINGLRAIVNGMIR